MQAIHGNFRPRLAKPGNPRGLRVRVACVWLWILPVLAGAWVQATAAAQSNVRAWSARGQVFVVWQIDASTPLTYDIYRSATPITTTADGTLAGRLFRPEWRGDRLRLVSSTATWRIPAPGGGSYQLAANEGLFVFTPHEAGISFFSVVRGGDNAVGSGNRTATAVPITFDPAGDPVTCHLQLSGVTSRGYPYRTYAMWADGRDDPNDARTDVPVLANAGKNGAPHVFTVFEPREGPPPAPSPATVCLHGGGDQGSHWSWAPESAHYANTGSVPVGGITVAMDDRIYFAVNGVVNEDRPTFWFGWHTGLDPVNNALPGNNALVVPYTMRRVMWTLDWLQARSPYAIDPDRVSIMGNSMGGVGTLLLSRWKPERFSAATSNVPVIDTPDTGQRLWGTVPQNLRTTETGPGGSVIRVNTFFDFNQRLSAPQRDFPLTRIYKGRCDESDAAWGVQVIGLFNDMTVSRWGTHFFWDHRDHTASDWTIDEAATPCPDIGEWVAPVRTERPIAASQARFRASQSFPGFFGDDQDTVASGRQPTPGNGSASDGDPWGTWCGYFDWDTGTIFDTPEGWGCTLFLVGKSATSVDNFPGDTATTSLTVRKPRKLMPASGATITWALRNDRSDAVLQTGAVAAESDGLVSVAGLLIPKDPQRVRLEFRVGTAPRPGDLDGDGWVDLKDVDRMQASPVDLDGDGVANAADVELLDRYVRRNSCPTDLDASGTVDAGDIAVLLLMFGQGGPADLDGDGSVSAGDVGLLLLTFGTCDQV